MNQAAPYLPARLSVELPELHATRPHAENIGADCIGDMPEPLLRNLLEK